MRCTSLILATLIYCGVTGCGSGVLTTSRYPDAIIGVDGQVLTIEALAAVGESERTEAEKRDDFNDLGIDDPDLIDALIELFGP